jgi:regulator of protease activity HflC (stomatin/prohibitin superfamily)
MNLELVLWMQYPFGEDRTISANIEREVARKVAPRGIVIKGTPLRKIALPAKVTDAIEDKLRAEQESQRMQFVLTKEKQEAERKRVEAQGVADFQCIVSEGINDNLLQ